MSFSSSKLYSGKRFRKAIQYFLLGRVAQSLMSFVLTLWLVRLLNAADYGAYMVLWGMVEMMMPLSSLGLLEAVRRFLPDLATRGTPDGLRKFVKWMTLVRIIILLTWTALIAFFWENVASWAGFSVSQQGATLFGVGLIITVLGFRYAAEMLECLLEQRWSQLTHAMMPLGRLVGVTLLVVMENLTLERILWVDLTVTLTCFLLCEYFLMQKLKNISVEGEFRVNAREIAIFAWHMAFVNFFRAMASMGALRTLVARTLGLETAGMYAFLQQLLAIIGRYLPANLLASIIRPMLISRNVVGEHETVGQGVALLWKSNLLFISLAMVVVSIAGDEIIELMSSGRFANAGMIMLIMLLGLGATSQDQLVSMVMQILSFTRQLRRFSLLLMLTPLAAIIGSHWGLLGVTSAIVLSVWLMNSLILLWLNKQVEYIKFDWFGTLRGVSFAIVLMGMGWLIKDRLGEWWTLVTVGLIYGVGLMIVKPLSRADMALLNKGVSNHFHYFSFFTWKS